MMGLHHGREYFDDALGLKVERARRGRQAHLHRRQRRRGARLRVRRRDGLRLVSDHAELVARRGVPEVLLQAARRQGDRQATSSRSSRPRTRSPRSASSIGAGWNGARAFTATSGPGVSLMTEFIGLAYFAEIPVTIIDVQRGGPSTGMPTRTQQADLLSLRLRLARRHQARAAVPRRPARVLRVRGRGARPRRPPADADLRDDRPRHRHEPPPVRAARLGRRAQLRPRQGDDAPRSSRPARTSAATSTSTATASRTARCPARTRAKGAYFTRGTTRDALRALLRGRARLRLQRAAAAEEVRDREGAGAAADRCARPRSATRFGAIYFGSTSPAMDEAFEALQAHGHPRRHAARARVPVQRRGRPLHRRARDGVRGRAEPRRAAAHDAGQRAGDRPGAARADPALRRHADHRALHHRGDRGARAGRQRRADRGQEGPGRR